MASDKTYKYKMILVGDVSVGKTALVVRVCDDQFFKNGYSTIGVDFRSYNIVLQRKSGEKRVRLNIWDTSGQEKFASLTSAYYRGACAAMLVYDISRRDTFEAIDKWLTRVKTLAQPDVIYMLVGNKADLRSEREVTYTEGLQFAEEHEMMFAEVSAKIGQSTTETFNSLADVIHTVWSKKQEPLPKPKKKSKRIRVSNEPSESPDDCAC